MGMFLLFATVPAALPAASGPTLAQSTSQDEADCLDRNHVHLQTHCTGQISAPALWLSGQVETGHVAQGRPSPPDSVQSAVWTTWRHDTVLQRSPVTEGWGNSGFGLGCGDRFG